MPEPLESRFENMNSKIMQEIKKIPFYANKQEYSGAFTTFPTGNLATRLIKCNYPGKNKIMSLDKILDAVELKDGMTISFHHCLRNGDKVMHYVVDAIAKKGIKDLTLSASSLSLVQDCLLPYLESGIITAIDTSGCRGNIGKFVQSGRLKRPAIFRTHGGRARAIETGELHIDVTFIAAPACDKYGNINGVQGKSACGSLGYAMPDAEYADHVVAVTDGLSSLPLDYVSIPQTQVDYITEIDSIGDPAGISTGSIRVSNNPAELVIAKYAADVILKSAYFKNDMTFQFGSGGIAIATASLLKKVMSENKIVASAGVGGVTDFTVGMMKDGLIRTFYDAQDFDTMAIKNLGENPKQQEVSVSAYANPFSNNPYVNMLDIAVLSATEADINFNVNVLTDSYGRLFGAPGGHPDAAAGAKITIITMPLLRGRLPMLLNKVQTIVTPGETVDVIVTDYGIAINPNRVDLLDQFAHTNLPIKSIEELKAKADKLAGTPEKTELNDEICGLVEYRDGTIIDVIHKL